MKVIVLGANHAGTSAIRTLLGLGKNLQVVAYDRNTNISFLGCGMALWVDGTVKNPKDLFYADKDLLTKMGAVIKMGHDVIEVNAKEKYVKVKNLKTGETIKDNYDKLVYAAGSWPIDPKFSGRELSGIEVCKIYQHAEILKRYADDKKVKNVAIIGAGYIGIEFAEAFAKAGKNVSLIDVIDRPIRRYFDKEFTDPLEVSMNAHNVKMLSGHKVMEFKGKDGKLTQVVTDKKVVDADIALLAIGFRPNTDMLLDLKKTKNGAVIVDKNMKSSNPDIYAIGDACALNFIPLNEHMNIALATNAVKTGVCAAADICGMGEAICLEGITGTNAINVFGQKLASTGVSETEAQTIGLDYEVSLFEDNDRPEFMNDNQKERVKIKLIYNPKTKVLLGAQIASYGERNHAEVIYQLSLAIQKRMTIYQLALSDVFFLPHFNKPFNFVIKAALGNPKWLQGSVTNPIEKK